MIHAQTPIKAPASKMVKLFDRFFLYVRMYRRTPSPEIMNHFQACAWAWIKCFGFAQDLDIQHLHLAF